MITLPKTVSERLDLSFGIFADGVKNTVATSKSKQGRLNFAAFQSKQRLFAVQAACVAGQLAVAADGRGGRESGWTLCSARWRRQRHGRL